MMTFDPQILFRRTIRQRQKRYQALLVGGEPTMQPVRHEMETLRTAAVEGLQIAELVEETAVFIDQLFPFIALWGEWPTWVEPLEKAILHHQERWRIRLFLGQWLSHCYELNRNFMDAYALLDPLLPVAEAHFPERLPILLHRLASIKLGMGEVMKAHLLLKRGFAQAKIGTTDHMQALLHNLQGQIALRQRKIQEAIEAFEKAIETWGQTQWPTNVARALLNLGVCYFYQAAYADAARCFEKSQQIAHEQNNPIDVIKAANNLANVFYKQQAYEQAERVLRNAIQAIQLGKGVDHLKASLHHNLGNTLLIRKRLDEAGVHLKHARYQWMLLEDCWEAAKTAETLGELEEARGHLMASAEYYQEAVQQAEQSNANTEALLARCRAGIARCWAQQANK